MKQNYTSQTNCSWLSVLSTLSTSFNPRKSSFAMAWRVTENESTNFEHCCAIGIRLCCYVQGLHHRHCLALLQIFGDATAQSPINATIHYPRCVHPSGECFEYTVTDDDDDDDGHFINCRKETTPPCYLIMMRQLHRA